MAFTIKTTKTVFGNMRVHVLSCTADAATQSIESGMDHVYGFSMTPISMATFSSHSAWANSAAAGTSTGGVIGVTGVASGDEFYLIVYGK